MTPTLVAILGLGLLAVGVILATWPRRRPPVVRAPDYRPKGDLIARPDRYQRAAEETMRAQERAAQERARERGRVSRAWLLLLPLLVACTNAAAVRHAERMAELNRGNAQDARVHPDARRVSLENADAWAVQLEALDDRPLPADVAERLAEGRGR